MPRELYNEGRVVGYSAYEIYVKHALSEFPDEEPATEREWLSAQIGNGASMILEVPSESEEVSGVHYVDFPLPENSKLLSANVIYGSIFFGRCKCNDDHWAVTVTGYGQGISNNSTIKPADEVEDATTYRTQNIAEFTTQKTKFLQYMKIQDAVILQPGAWQDTNSEPSRDLIPNYSKRPVVRIIFASRITTSFYLLLTGFTHRAIIAGISGISTGSVDTDHPENGDFLGPELYPWANKVILIQPPITTYYLRKYLKSNHATSTKKNPLYDSTSESGRKDNLKINADENSIDTIFTSSYLYSSDGITISGPTVDGGDITIGAKVASTNNYMKVSQDHSDTEHKIATTLTPSVLQPGDGVNIIQPSSAGSQVTIASKIKSTSNLLKVSQTSSSNISDFTTTLTPAKVGNGLTLKEDPQGSGNYTIELNAGIFKAGDGITITQNSEGQLVFSAKNTTSISTNTPEYLTITNDNGSFNINLNMGNLKNFFKPYFNAIWKAIKSILDRFPGTNKLKQMKQDGAEWPPTSPSNSIGTNGYTGQISFDDSVFPDGKGNIAVGNLNVYSSTDGTHADRWIKTHKSAADGDLRVK